MLIIDYDLLDQLPDKPLIIFCWFSTLVSDELHHLLYPFRGSIPCRFIQEHLSLVITQLIYFFCHDPVSLTCEFYLFS